jgi:hypothetical protein
MTRGEDDHGGVAAQEPAHLMTARRRSRGAHRPESAETHPSPGDIRSQRRDLHEQPADVVMVYREQRVVSDVAGWVPEADENTPVWTPNSRRKSIGANTTAVTIRQTQKVGKMRRTRCQRKRGSDL